MIIMKFRIIIIAATTKFGLFRLIYKDYTNIIFALTNLMNHNNIRLI